MELFFRKYFWVVNLLFLACAAYFSSRIAGALIERQLQPPVSAMLSPERAKVVESTKKAGVSPEALSKLTGIEIPKEQLSAEAAEEAERQAAEARAAEEKAAAEGGAAAENEALERSPLRAKLLGTTLANVDEWSIATLLDMDASKSSPYRIGDEILGAQIVGIELRRVIVVNEGHREYIDATEPSGGTASKSGLKPFPKKENKAPDVPDGSGIRATAANTYEVPRDELQKAMDNMSQLASQARIVPSFKNGESQGFKIFAIKPNSLYTKLGIQNGDIIKRVNGFDINSPDKALELYSKLQNSNRIEIEFDRGGTATRKTYNIR